RARPVVPLLVLAAGSGGGARGAARGGTGLALSRPVPRHPEGRGGPPAPRRRAGRGAVQRRRGRREGRGGRIRGPGARRGALPAVADRRFRPSAPGWMAVLQLRRGGGRPA